MSIQHEGWDQFSYFPTRLSLSCYILMEGPLGVTTCFAVGTNVSGLGPSTAGIPLVLKYPSEAEATWGQKREFPRRAGEGRAQGTAL